MGNEKNLRTPSTEEAREMQKKSAKARSENIKRKKDIRLAMEALLEKNYNIEDGQELTGAEAIALKQMEKALKGDTKAFEVVRDTSGQSVVQKVAIAEVDADIIKEVEEMVLEDN